MPHSKVSPSAASDPEHPLMQAALTILEQGEQLLLLVPGPAYVQPSALVFNASIGGHYRHCLDHFGSFLNGLAKGVIDYDQRERDPVIERNRDAARSLTRSLRDRLESIGESALQLPVRVRGTVSYGPECSPTSESSATRELAYVIAHAIHHFALIAVIARLNGVALPEDFGMAPSTLAYRRRGFVPSNGNSNAIAH
jgi:uncharacterized damage-inducible protein DinB